MKNPYSQYRQTQVETTPKMKLIVMLYDGAIRFLQQGIAPMKSGNFEQKGLMINKATAILYHLTGTLDYVQGGELAVNLCRTYEYLIRRLVLANQTNDPEIVEEVITHLRELRSAWNQVAIAGSEADAAAVPKPISSHADLSLAA